jgi:hypothetical protein
VRPIGERGHAALGRRRCSYLESRAYTAWMAGRPEMQPRVELDLALDRIEIGNFPDYLSGTAIEASPNGRGVWERELIVGEEDVV